MMSKIKKKKLLMYILLYLTIMSLVTVINKTKAAGHSLEIESPSDGMVITNAYRTALNSLEQTTIKFEFEINNHDHYYALYETWIDGIYDKTLIDSGFNKWIVYFHGVFYYDAQSFLDRYGQGVHTFSLWALHPITVTVGFAEGPGPDDDVLFINGTTYRITEVSVTFTFNPPVVHFVGFWLKTNDIYTFNCDIIPIREFFHAEHSYYLHGYTYITGDWDYTTPYSIFVNNLNPHEDSNDLDIIIFFTHGNMNTKDKMRCTLPKGFTYCLKFSKLRSYLDNAALDSSHIIVILDCCYSGNAISCFQGSNYILLTACGPNETADAITSYYKSSCSLHTKIDHIASFFLRALFIGLYENETLSGAFNNVKNYDLHWWPTSSSYSHQGPIKCDEQNPMSLNLEQAEEIIFYYNPKDKNFFETYP